MVACVEVESVINLHMRGRVNGLVESSMVGFRNRERTGRARAGGAGIKILPLYVINFKRKKKNFRARAAARAQVAGTAWD